MWKYRPVVWLLIMIAAIATLVYCLTPVWQNFTKFRVEYNHLYELKTQEITEGKSAELDSEIKATARKCISIWERGWFWRGK